MAIRSDKKRVMITLPKTQAEWMERFCKEHRLTISHYISWILAKKAEEMIKILQVDRNTYTEEELERIIEIIKTPWVE